MRHTRVSAYIPCYNNAATMAAAIESVRRQNCPVDDLFVVDDGSEDRSRDAVKVLGVRLIAHEANLGRGAVRARAMEVASEDLVLSCDATIELIPEFVERALPWFDTDNVAAVYGRIGRGVGENPGQRWRSRHMYKENLVESSRHGASLATGGAVLRRSAVLAVGNFDKALRHTEDAELGARLLAAGYDVVFDPALLLRSNKVENWLQVLERYRRWYGGKDEQVSWKDYSRQIVYSIKVMAWEDLKAGDVATVPISLIQPHYQFWKSVWRGGMRKRG